jgi:hypothetical protein
VEEDQDERVMMRAKYTRAAAQGRGARPPSRGNGVPCAVRRAVRDTGGRWVAMSPVDVRFASRRTKFSLREDRYHGAPFAI